MRRTLPESLTTLRLKLRRPRVADAQAIFAAYAQDPQVCRYMVWAPHSELSITEGFVASCIGDWEGGPRLPYVITLHESDLAIGMIEARGQGSAVDVGYVLAPAQWGRGLMPEAIDALAGAALADLSTFRVQASCDVDNRPSQRALEKSGFGREGRLERHTVHPNLSPEPRPCFMYARCR